jgi:hypothetical protein
VDVMKDNLEKVLERDAKLGSLETRAGMLRKYFSQWMINFFKLDQLQNGAQQFTTNASRLKSKYWWKNLKVSY